MPFQKGQSGNPNGRPKDTPQIVAAKEALKGLAPDAVAKIKKCLSSGKFNEYKWAAETVLAYALGKPAQAVELSGKEGRPLTALLTIVRKQADDGGN